MLSACSVEAPGAVAARAHRPLERTRPPGKSRLDTTPTVITGALVRVWRRPVTSGVIQVIQQRVADAAAARALATGLVEDGWRPWPPTAEPEHAAALAAARPELAGCPFLVEAAEEPASWSDPPPTHIACCRTLADLETVLVRDEVIRYKHGRALACAEIVAASAGDATWRRDRHEECLALEPPEPEPTEEETREAGRRHERNRRQVQVVKQSTRPKK